MENNKRVDQLAIDTRKKMPAALVLMGKPYLPADAGVELDLFIEHDSRGLRAALAVCARQHHRAAKYNCSGRTVLITGLGHDGRKYRREATKRLRAIVSEVYPAPCVTVLARRHPRLGVLPGPALDVTVHDDDDDDDDGKP